MNRRIIRSGVIILVLVLLIGSCITIVQQGRTGVLMSFGKPVKVITDPGIHVKLPYPIHRTQQIDSRLLLLEPKPSEFLTADK